MIYFGQFSDDSNPIQSPLRLYRSSDWIWGNPSSCNNLGSQGDLYLKLRNKLQTNWQES